MTTQSFISLPQDLANVINEVQQTTQAPYELILSVLLAAISLAVQHRCRVQQKPGLEGPTSLYLMIVADSGERKSAVQRLFFQPFIEAQRNHEDLARKKLSEVMVTHVLWEERRDYIFKKYKAAIEKGNSSEELEAEYCAILLAEPKPEKPSRLIYADVTPEALMWGLQQHGNSAAVVLDEFGQFVHGHLSRQLPLLNQIWSGLDCIVDRKNGGSFTVRDANLTAIFQAQPGVWKKFLQQRGEESRNNGFLARLLVSIPVSTQGIRFEKDAAITKTPHLDYFYEKCKHHLSKLDKRLIQFSPDAQIRYIEIKNWFESQMQPGGRYQMARDFASKAPEHLARISAVLHTFCNDEDDQISSEFLEYGLSILNYFGEQFLRYTDPSSHISEQQRDLMELQQWIARELQRLQWQILPYSHIMQYGPNRLRNKEKLRYLLDILIANQAIFVHRVGKRLAFQYNWNLMQAQVAY